MTICANNSGYWTNKLLKALYAIDLEKIKKILKINAKIPNVFIFVEKI